MTDDKTTLTVADVAGELIDDWRYLLGALHARFDTGDFATGLRLVEAIGESAEAADHHPDVDLRYPFVAVKLSSHDVGGATQRDVRLAREITAHAGRLQAKARPDLVSVLELGLDTRAHPEVAPFWAAVLGLAHDEGDNWMVDPSGRTPAVWFQEAPDATSQAPQRWHLDLTVAPETVDSRVKAALAAGGTLVSEARAPSFVVLADAHGNQVCLCTSLGRTEQVPVDE